MLQLAATPLPRAMLHTVLWPIVGMVAPMLARGLSSSPIARKGVLYQPAEDFGSRSSPHFCEIASVWW
jgi:hypothetical protein